MQQIGALWILAVWDSKEKSSSRIATQRLRPRNENRYQKDICTLSLSYLMVEQRSIGLYIHCGIIQT